MYGICCKLDKETGQAIISDEEKETMQNICKKYLEYCKQNLSQENFIKKMGEIRCRYHLCYNTVELL
jgi:hypothetical protein